MKDAIDKLKEKHLPVLFSIEDLSAIFNMKVDMDEDDDTDEDRWILDYEDKGADSLD